MKDRSRPRVVGGVVAIVAIAAIAIGLLLIGSPAEERRRRLDERRVEDLASIARAVDLYWTRHASLPSSLDDLRKEPGADVSSLDPSTSDSYEYRPLQSEAFELCAQFEQASGQAAGTLGNGFWSHGVGRQCFRREAQKTT